MGGHKHKAKIISIAGKIKGSRKNITLLMVVSLRGGGVKTLQLSKFLFSIILMAFKNEKYFTLDNLSTY